MGTLFYDRLGCSFNMRVPKKACFPLLSIKAGPILQRALQAFCCFSTQISAGRFRILSPISPSHSCEKAFAAITRVNF